MIIVIILAAIGLACSKNMPNEDDSIAGLVAMVVAILVIAWWL